MAACELCGKIGVAGFNVSFSKRHTKTRFMPNIKRATVPIKGKVRQAYVCTRCLRTLSKVTT